jgi:hypothetical protein
MFCIQMDTKQGSTLCLSGDKYIYHRIDIKLSHLRNYIKDYQDCDSQFHHTLT